MTANLCVHCGRPTPDGYADVVCGVERPRTWLAEIADMVPAARDVAQRQARRGIGGGASGKPGSSLPISLPDADRLDKVQRRLDRWAAQIASERGKVPPWLLTHGDPLSAVSGWLSAHCEWIRHHGYTTNTAWTRIFLPHDQPDTIAAQFLDAIEDCARVVRGIARGPGEQRYLGPCGAEPAECNPIRHAPDCPEDCGMRRCEGDVYGWAGADKGTCRTCGARVVQAERRAWLGEQVAGRAYRAAHIADAYRISVNTIRSWALRGRLIEHGHDGDGRPLYLVRDVLELALEAAARRAENEAKRARREAAEMGA
jgi:hypothetical protein